MYKPRRVVVGSIFALLAFTLIAAHGFAQSPPTATEAFNLRIKCKKMSDEKAQYLTGSIEVVAASNTSKYDPISNRCYGRFYQHTTNEHTTNRTKDLDGEHDSLYDLQIDDLLAMATIVNGKKNGIYFGYRGPSWPSCSAKGCPPDYGDQMWQATEDYINEIMADPRKQ
jgi:hypothetical protein